MCTTRALEAPSSTNRYYGNRLLTEYLIARTLADNECEHHLSAVVRDTVFYILQERPEDRGRREEYMRALCVATVQSHGPWEFGNIYQIIKPTRPRLCPYPLRPRQCSFFENALGATAYLGLNSLVERLISIGVRDDLTYFGWSINIFAGKGDVEMTRLILESGNHIRESRRQALGNAASNGHICVMKVLLEEKYNKDIPDDAFEWTTFEWVIRRAAASGQVAVLQFLIEVVDSRGLLKAPRRTFLWSDQNNPLAALYDVILWTAALEGQEEVVKRALDRGANANIMRGPPSKVCTALDGASKNGHEGVVRLLLTRGAKLQICRSSYPLIHAVRGGWLRIAQILIHSGAEVNPMTKRKERFPLVAAVQRGQADSVLLLLRNGAHLKRLGIGKAAYLHARECGYTTIMSMLVEYGVDDTSVDLALEVDIEKEPLLIDEFFQTLSLDC